MSEFTAEIVVLDDVLPHPNADRLEIAQIGGYHAVVGKGEFHKGAWALYIPEDAVVPEYVLEAIGLTGKLAGSKHNRVKAIKLRGVLSQGIVVSTAIVHKLIEADRERYTELFPQHITTGGWWVIDLGQDLAEFLCITKYEEPIPLQMQGVAIPRPAWFPKYTDIQNVKKYNRTLVDGEEVIITEKCHGSNMGVGMHRDDRKMLVSSHNFVLEREETNVYWRAAEQYNLAQHLNSILDGTGAESVVVYGEVYGPGVQDLAYGLLPGSIGFVAFDMMLDGEYVGAEMFIELAGPMAYWLDDDVMGTYSVTYDIPIVPILYQGPWHDYLIDQLTSGATTFGADHIREGFVVKPVRERRTAHLNRVILKSVSPDYLLRKSGTERH